MKKLLRLWVLCLAMMAVGYGCTVDTGETSEGTGGAPSAPSDEGVEGWGPGGPASPESQGGHPCGYDVQVFPMPDGSEIVMVIPLECNLFWFDTGDPAPESNNPFDSYGQPIDESIQEQQSY